MKKTNNRLPDLDEIERLRQAAIEEVRPQAMALLADNGLTDKMELDDVTFNQNGSVTFHFVPKVGQLVKF